MKKYVCLSYLLTFGSLVYSQESDSHSNRKNTIDVTLGGTGVLISTNYSHILVNTEKYFINGSLGIGLLPSSASITIPHQLTLNVGRKNSFLELGVGGTYWQRNTMPNGKTIKVDSYLLSPIVGWRKNLKNNLVLRIYANPFFHISGTYIFEDYKILPFAGTSLGYSF